MPFCTNCGSQLPPSSKFCPGCGTKVPTTTVTAKAAQFSSANRSPDSLLAPSKQTQGQGSLTGTTQAVRTYIAGASEEEKEKKYGQQKWGLFETDYQRRKGITTEESLQEIEDFARNGVTVGGTATRSTASATSAATAGYSGSAGYTSAGSYGVATAGTTQGFSQANVREVDGRGGFGGAAGSPRGAGGFGGVGGRGQGTGTFGSGDQCDAGAKFFAQHQQNEARKFKPGYKGQPYK